MIRGYQTPTEEVRVHDVHFDNITFMGNKCETWQDMRLVTELANDIYVNGVRTCRQMKFWEYHHIEKIQGQLSSQVSGRGWNYPGKGCSWNQKDLSRRAWLECVETLLCGFCADDFSMKQKSLQVIEYSWIKEMVIPWICFVKRSINWRRNLNNAGSCWTLSGMRTASTLYASWWICRLMAVLYWRLSSRRIIRAAIPWYEKDHKGVT